MKILTASEMRAADEATFKTIGVPSRAVMESAGRHCASFIAGYFAAEAVVGVLVVTGSGNNGGDGFVIARALHNIGMNVAVLAMKHVAGLKGDALSAAKAYAASGGKVTEYNEKKWKAQEAALRAEPCGLIVDAILGTGLSGEVTGPAAVGIDFLNALATSKKAAVVSIDVPSGIDSETGAVCGRAVSATTTVALQCLKPGHVLFPASTACGGVVLADIGIGNGLEEISSVNRELVTIERVLGYFKESRAVRPDAHKGRRGHVLVIGGGAGKFGAPRLSGEAALHAGAGLVTLGLPESAARESASALKELMSEGLPEADGEFSPDAVKALAKIAEGKDAIVIGPGMGEGAGATALLKETLKLCKKEKLPLVIDADALNILAAHPELVKELPRDAVLTPHPGEMSRLAKKSIEDVQGNRLELAKNFSRKSGAVTVLKGARTVIADAEGALFVNPAATAVLGTAGSGDSLAGIIGALAGQGLAASHAAVTGVYAHGIAGEILERRAGGVFGTIATDIGAETARVMNALQRAVEDPPVKSFLRQALPDPFLEVYPISGSGER